MADLASTAVTLRKADQLGTRAGQLRGVRKSLTIVLAAMGTATNKVLASALGFTTVLETSCFVKSDNSEILVATPSYDGTYILLKAAGTNAPADFTGTYRAVVVGDIA
jgi:hypothetical protein